MQWQQVTEMSVICNPPNMYTVGQTRHNKEVMLLFPEGKRCKNELFYSKSRFSLRVSAKQERHIVWFHKHKIELKYV